jgi:hypothetical protein
LRKVLEGRYNGTGPFRSNKKVKRFWILKDVNNVFDSLRQ